MRSVFETMGTVASIELAADEPDALDGIRGIFADAEKRFSLYRPGSELSRVNAGERPLAAASAELRDAYALAMDWHLRTAGAFTPNRPDGSIDLNGVVKALCISRAGELLHSLALKDWSINVGGDVLCAGLSPTGDWVIGIVDPVDRQSLLCALPLGEGRRAIATSGSAERGDHIWTIDRDTAAEFVQVSVIAEDILAADVLATAIISGGIEMLDLATDTWAIDVLAVRTDGSLLATPGVRSLISV